MLRNEKGFTLIELVMIIIILGILAAVAVPRYVDLQQEARTAVLDASVGAVKSAAIIQYARTRDTNTFSTIWGNTDLDSAITRDKTTCDKNGTTYTDIVLTHSGGGTRTFSLQSVYCSS
jgi:MSHA pilin protein MshA